MMWFQVRITIRFSLHEQVRIFESSLMSVFESHVWVHNDHKSGSPVIGFRSHERVRVLQLKHTLTYIFTRIVTHARIHTSTHTHIYIQICTYAQTCTQTYTYTCTHAHIYTGKLKHIN